MMQKIPVARLTPGTLRFNSVFLNPSILSRKMNTSVSKTQENDSAPAESPKSEYEVDTAGKVVKTAVGALPLSPWMDSTFFETRNKFLDTKPKSSGYKKTKFQQRLRRNIYAMALASPPRRCAISMCTLPTFFFQRFKLVQHPETKEAWFVPQDLEKSSRLHSPDYISTNVEDAGSDDVGDIEKAAEAVEEIPTEQSDGLISEKAQRRDSKRPTPGPAAYTLNSRRLLDDFFVKSSPYSGQYRKLLRMNDGAGLLRQTLNSARWRSDMDSALLDIMRKRIVERLLEAATSVERRGRKYIQPCSWGNVGEFNHLGCLVYLGQAEGPSAGSEKADLPRLSALTAGKRYDWKVAVHDLRVLLGEEYISHLREQSPLLRGGSLFLLGRTATQPLRLLLWKLQGYVSLDH